MKKTKKITLLLFCILLIGVIHVFFYLYNLDIIFGSHPSDVFVEKYTEFFQKPEGFNVYDKMDNDITEAFLKKHQKDFEHGDFDSIYKDVVENEYCLSSPLLFNTKTNA